MPWERGTQEKVLLWSEDGTGERKKKPVPEPGVSASLWGWVSWRGASVVPTLMAHLQFLLPGILRWEEALAPTQMSQLAADLMGTPFNETQSLIFTTALTHTMSTWVRNLLGFFFSF